MELGLQIGRFPEAGSLARTKLSETKESSCGSGLAILSHFRLCLAGSAVGLLV